MSKSTTLRIKLVRSPCGRMPNHRKSVNALGLRKINQVVEREDTPQVRGLINTVHYLVEVL